MSLKRSWDSYKVTDYYYIQRQQEQQELTMGAKHSSMTHSSKKTKRSNSNVKLNQSRTTTTYSGYQNQTHQQSLKSPLQNTTITNNKDTINNTTYSVPATK